MYVGRESTPYSADPPGVDMSVGTSPEPEGFCGAQNVLSWLGDIAGYYGIPISYMRCL